MFDSPCEKNIQETGHKGLYGYTRDPQEHIDEDYSLLHIFSLMLFISPYPQHFIFFRNKILSNFKKDINNIWS